MNTRRDDEETISNKHVWITIIKGQEGSVIVIALLILVTLTLGGITATQRSTTESFIVRNTAIYKQNLQLAETAAMEGIGELMRREDLTEDWVNDKSIWDDNPANADDSDDNSYPLTDDNSRIPVAVEEGELAVLEQRGEIERDAGGNVTNSTLRYYVIGWDHSAAGAGGSDSIVSKPGKGRWQRGRVIGSYDSPRFGGKTIEIGAKIFRLEE